MDANGEAHYPERDVEVVLACRNLRRHGLEAKHLRRFRTSADNAVDVLHQLVAPLLASQNPERRVAAVEDLEELGAVGAELQQALFWRALRSLVT
jgi:hypothetical protein